MVEAPTPIDFPLAFTPAGSPPASPRLACLEARAARAVAARFACAVGGGCGFAPPLRSSPLAEGAPRQNDLRASPLANIALPILKQQPARRLAHDPNLYSKMCSSDGQQWLCSVCSTTNPDSSDVCGNGACMLSRSICGVERWWEGTRRRCSRAAAAETASLKTIAPTRPRCPISRRARTTKGSRKRRRDRGGSLSLLAMALCRPFAPPSLEPPQENAPRSGSCYKVCLLAVAEQLLLLARGTGAPKC